MTTNYDPIEVVNRFKQFYQSITDMPLDNIEHIYSKDIIFKDPVHEVRGISDVHRYMSDLCSELSHGRFEYLDELIDENRAYIKWNMHFSHPKLGDKNISVRGITQIEFNESIYYHEDVYDMGEMLYEHIPLLGGLTRFIKRRLAV